MKVILTGLLTLCIVACCNAQRADTLRNTSHYYYLADINISTIGRWILSDSIAPSDNYVTFRCLDGLTAKQKETRDYFFPVFMKIVEKADGALAEAVGSPALNYTKTFPMELANRFKCCPGSALCCEQLKRFSSFVGAEIMMADDNQKAYDDFVKGLARAVPNWKSNKTLTQLMDQVDKVRRTW